VGRHTVGEYEGGEKGEPLEAGVEYFSGREPGGGCRFTEGRGRPLDIAGSTATASPIATRRCQECTTQFRKTLTEFLPEALGAEMIEGVVGGLSGRHRRSKVESAVRRILNG
jgi:hypothetical protein